MALVLLLGTLTVVPPRHRLFPGKTTPEDGALGAEVAAVEKVAEDGVLSTLACWQDKSQGVWILW